MAVYWKHYVWEYLMCVVAAAMLLLNTAQGFFIPDKMADSLPLALGTCGVLLAFFFLGGYNRLTLFLIPALTAVLAVLAFLLLRSSGVDIVDKAGSSTAFYIYWFALAVICIGVYLLSRTRVGVIVLFLTGSCAHGMLEFLEYAVYPWAGIVFAGSCILLFLLRQYRLQALRSSTTQPDFFRFFRSGFLMILSAALLSYGMFLAAIAPLHLPVMKLEFLERYLAFRIVEHTGISSYYSIPNPELLTNQANNLLDDHQDSGEIPTEEQEEPETWPDSAVNSSDAPDSLSGQTGLSAVSYTATAVTKIISVILLVTLALALPPLIKLQMRKRKIQRLQAMEPKQQIQALYAFYLKKFQHLGWRRREGETPLEFAARSQDALSRYLSGTCGLAVLTDAFMLARYGAKAPSAECCAQCRNIYDLLLKNCRQQMGWRRYMLKFYVL